jgi:MFS superfamily sulfate permease-like transporter
MLLGVLTGLVVAIAVSLGRLLHSLARPRLVELGRVGDHDYLSLERFPGAVTVTGMRVLRPEEPLFFANADPLFAQMRARVAEAPPAKLVVLSLEESPDLDSTAIEALGEFCRWLSACGGELRLARLKEAAREALLRADLTEVPASALDYSSVDDAVRGVSVTPEPH